jgi:hypothetical protein
MPLVTFMLLACIQEYKLLDMTQIPLENVLHLRSLWNVHLGKF